MNTKIYITMIFIISVVLVSQAFIIGTAKDTTINFGIKGIGLLDISSLGDEDTTQTAISNTYWAWDKINVVTGEGATSVLDQLVFADSAQTKISRNALFIGPGSIEAMSQYFGSNVDDGEDSVTGILIQGENYGALIQNGSLSFNEDFGGIEEALATGGGNYSVEQFGGFGNIDIDGSGSYIPGTDDPWTFVALSGDRSGTIGSTGFGSAPQSGPDVFTAKTAAWATGVTEKTNYSFGAYSDCTSFEMNAILTWGQTYTTADLERIIAEASLSINDY